MKRKRFVSFKERKQYRRSREGAAAGLLGAKWDAVTDSHAESLVSITLDGDEHD